MFYLILKGITYIVEWVGKLYDYMPDIGYRRNIVWRSGGTWFTQYCLFSAALNSAGVHYMCLKGVSTSSPELSKPSYTGENVKKKVLAIEVHDMSTGAEYDITDLWNSMSVPPVINTIDLCYLAEWYHNMSMNCWNSMVNVVTCTGEVKMYNGLIKVEDFDGSVRASQVGRSLRAPAMSPPIIESRGGSPVTPE
jgi:hypothetical protein